MERKRAKDTHHLESTEGGTSHDTKRKCVSELLTSLRVRGEGQVRARKGRNQTSEGHSLPGAYKGRDKLGNNKQANQGHSLSGEHKGRDKLGYGRIKSER
jgi:hypothetical protein